MIIDPLQSAIRTFLSGYSATSKEQVSAFQIGLRGLDQDAVLKGLPMAFQHFSDRRPTPGQLKLYLETATGASRHASGGIARDSSDPYDRVQLERDYRATVDYGSVVRAGATHRVLHKPRMAPCKPLDKSHEFYWLMSSLAQKWGMQWPLEVETSERINPRFMVTIPLPHGGWWARGMGVAAYDEYGSASMVAVHPAWEGKLLPDDVFSEGADAFVEMA